MFDPRQAPPACPPTSRGQTTVDFAIGASVFLIVLLFALTFVPGMLQPFAEGTAAETVGSNRAADTLVRSLLGDPSTPYLVNTTCAIGFFNASTPDTCAYSGATAAERLAIGDGQHVNVTLRGSVTDPAYDRLCWNGTALTEADSTHCGAGDLRLQTGPSVPSGTLPTVTARRVVGLRGDLVVLRVVMW